MRHLCYERLRRMIADFRPRASRENPIAQEAISRRSGEGQDVRPGPPRSPPHGPDSNRAPLRQEAALPMRPLLGHVGTGHWPLATAPRAPVPLSADGHARDQGGGTRCLVTPQPGHTATRADRSRRTARWPAVARTGTGHRRPQGARRPPRQGVRAISRMHPLCMLCAYPVHRGSGRFQNPHLSRRKASATPRPSGAMPCAVPSMIWAKTSLKPACSSASAACGSESTGTTSS